MPGSERDAGAAPAATARDAERRSRPRGEPPAPSRLRLLVVGLGLVALLAAAWWLGRRQGDAAAPTAAPKPPAAVGGVRPAPAAGALPSVAGTDVAALRAHLAASSLRDATADGAYRRDAGGALVPDAGLVRRFDWYLTLTGEFSAAQIRALLAADAADAFAPPADLRVVDLFDAYVAMRAEMAAGDIASDLPTRLAQVRAAHRRWFGVHAEAMFGEEEAALAYTVERLALARDASLSADQRAARLQALAASRPASARADEFDATAVQIAEDQERDFADRGVDAAGRHAERAALWGDAAADRLAALDAQRADWDRRLADYLRERQRLLADPSLDATQRDQAIAALLAARFSGTERARADALSRLP